MLLKGKKIMVLGATGQIGSAAVKGLLVRGAEVLCLCRNIAKYADVFGETTPLYPGKMRYERFILNELNADICGTGKICFEGDFDGMVYAIGSCERGCLEKEISTPLINIPREIIRRQSILYSEGFVSALQFFFDALKQRADVVAISSAVTRFPVQQARPSFLHCAHYAMAKRALDTSIEWLRSELPEGRLRIHRLAPSAVATHFFEGAVPMPPRVSLERMSNEIADCFSSAEIVDKFIFPEGSAQG